jgi:L-alanine-DL-glutamate epimerase-like enolase superfamily enzyme
MTTRLLTIDARPRFGDEGVPPGRPATWIYPFTTLHTDEGIDGYTMGYGNQGDGRALAQVLHGVFHDEIVGEDPTAIEALWQKLRRLNRHLYAASDAFVGMIDVACWDILGKVAGQPIATLLGLRRTSVPAYATGWAFHPTPEGIYDEVRRMAAEGFTAYKLHFWNDLATDLPCIHAAREAAGPDYVLMQDFSGKYRYTDALAVGRVLDDLGFHWFEEPIPDRQIGNLRRLTDQLRTPILAGETLRLDELAIYLQQGALDIARGDVYMKAGITGLRKAMALCELHGVNLEVHTMASPLLDVANLHVTLAADNAEYAEVIHPVYRFGLVGKPLDIDPAGRLHLPPGPGLGVELDWDWIDNHTVGVLTGRGE